jgi:hypothetical protein
MYAGQTLFAQLMEFVPWTTFARLVERHCGDHRVRRLTCAEQYRAMSFAQLTYRESLRDIETCLSAQAAKLYHMGFREPVRRSTLADANETRDWRIYAALAQTLIVRARKLYAGEDLGLDLKNTVYALDSTTIDLCLSVFPWAHFRSTKSAVKMHTLLDLRGDIPSFIHISDGKLHDVHALDMLVPEAGAIYVMDRGYIDFGRLYGLHQAGAFFVTRAKTNLNAHRVYSASTDRIGGVIADQTIALDGTRSRQDYPCICGASVSGTPRPRDWQNAGVPHQSDHPAGVNDLRPLQEPLEGGAFLQVDQTAPADQAVLWHVGERRENPNLDRGVGVCLGRHRPQTAEHRGIALHIDAGLFGGNIRKGGDKNCIFARNLQFRGRHRK